MKSFKIDKRIKDILKLLPKSECVADIGCDHGFACVSAVLDKKTKCAIAADISDLSLNKARRLVSDEGLEDAFEFRCGDGLKVLEKNEADSIIVAGVGGELLAKILEDGKHVLSENTRLVLSANNREDVVRRWLCDNNFKITNEKVVFEKGKYYQIMLVEYGQDKLYSNLQLELGKINIQNQSVIFKQYVNYKINGKQIILNNIKKNSRDIEKQNEIANKIDEYKGIIL